MLSYEELVLVLLPLFFVIGVMFFQLGPVDPLGLLNENNTCLLMKAFRGTKYPFRSGMLITILLLSKFVATYF